MDVLLVLIVIIVFGMALLFGFKIANEFNDNIQGNNDMPTEAKETGDLLVSNYTGILDNTFLFLIVGAGIGVFILAALVRVHPIFIPIYIIAALLVIVLGGIFSNIYQEAAATPELSSEADSLTFTSKIMIRLPIFIAIFSFLMMVILYKNWRVRQS